MDEFEKTLTEYQLDQRALTPNGGAVHISQSPPPIAVVGDMWIQPTTQKLSVFGSDQDWVTVSSDSTDYAPPGSTEYLPCSKNGHEVADNEKDGPIVYEDGLIIGYCKHCSQRVSIPFVAGGTNLIRLRELGAQLLAADRIHGETVPLIEFHEAFQEMHEQFLAIKELMSSSQDIKQVIIARWEAEKAEDE